MESGHLTPTLKVKRRVVERDFANLVEALYGSESPAVPGPVEESVLSS